MRARSTTTASAGTATRPRSRSTKRCSSPAMIRFSGNAYVGLASGRASHDLLDRVEQLVEQHSVGVATFVAAADDVAEDEGGIDALGLTRYQLHGDDLARAEVEREYEPDAEYHPGAVVTREHVEGRNVDHAYWPARHPPAASAMFLPVRWRCSCVYGREMESAPSSLGAELAAELAVAAEGERRLSGLDQLGVARFDFFL